MLKTKEEYANLYEFLPKERLTREAFTNMLDLIESLRRVARAAQAHKDTDWEFAPDFSVDWLTTWGAVLIALDALPQWVLEENDE